MEFIKNVAEQHDNTLEERQKIVKETVTDICEVEEGNFKCAKCHKLVPPEDTFNIHVEIGKKMCEFCTMVSQYG